MKTIILTLFVLLFSSSALAQDAMNSKGQAVAKNEQNAPVELKLGEKITRGAALAGGTQKVSMEKVFKSPDKYAGKAVAVRSPARFRLAEAAPERSCR